MEKFNKEQYPGYLQEDKQFFGTSDEFKEFRNQKAITMSNKFIEITENTKENPFTKWINQELTWEQSQESKMKEELKSPIEDMWHRAELIGEKQNFFPLAPEECFTAEQLLKKHYDGIEKKYEEIRNKMYSWMMKLDGSDRESYKSYFEL